MHTTILATFFEISRTAASMCGVGVLLFLVALWAAKTDIARAGGRVPQVALLYLGVLTSSKILSSKHHSETSSRYLAASKVLKIAIDKLYKCAIIVFARSARFLPAPLSHARPPRRPSSRSSIRVSPIRNPSRINTYRCVHSEQVKIL